VGTGGSRDGPALQNFIFHCPAYSNTVRKIGSQAEHAVGVKNAKDFAIVRIVIGVSVVCFCWSEGGRLSGVGTVQKGL
jgi:hypothetical protein